MELNRLFYGDNLDVMRNKMKPESVDLIYLDPPFSFKRNYNLMYRTMTGRPVPELVHRTNSGFPTIRKTGDRVIDGRLYFSTKDGLKSMVLQVKGGRVTPSDIRDLNGVLKRESDVELAGFMSIKEPTVGMKREAAEAGMYELDGHQYERIQFLTVSHVIEGNRMFNTPTTITVKGETRQINLPIS